MKKALLTSTLCMAFASLMGQTAVSNLNASSPVFNRPDAGSPATSLATGPGTNVYYQQFAIPIATGGNYTITSASTYNNYGILYNTGGFDPLLPLNNNIQASTNGPASVVSALLAAGNYTYVFTTVDDLTTGPFSFTVTGPIAIPLPVKLTGFSVKKLTNNQAGISWTTVGAENLAGFEIEKSADGIHYTTITKTAAQTGRDQEEKSYSFTDNALSTGRSIYRLKIIDLNGSMSYSNTQVLMDGKADYAGIYPNPAGETIYFAYNAAENGNVSIHISDLTGRTVKSGTYYLNKGNNAIPLELGALQPSSYLLNWTAGNEKGRLNIQKH